MSGMLFSSAHIKWIILRRANEYQKSHPAIWQELGVEKSGYIIGHFSSYSGVQFIIAISDHDPANRTERYFCPSNINTHQASSAAIANFNLDRNTCSDSNRFSYSNFYP